VRNSRARQGIRSAARTPSDHAEAARKSPRTASERVPRYLQVAALLRARIRDGHWKLGNRIATVAELQDELQVARVTVRQAIELLTQEGLLRAHQGKGTFVTRKVVADRWLRLAADWDGLIAPIRGNVPVPLRVKHPPAPRIGPEDGTPGPAYHYLRSVQRRGREPFALASVHIAQDAYARAPNRYDTEVALVVLLEREARRIGRARMSFSAGAAGLEASKHLAVPIDAPIVEARCVVADTAGVVLYVGEFVYPAGVVQFDVELTGPVV
jgi:GntR family transcriptional regulator